MHQLKTVVSLFILACLIGVYLGISAHAISTEYYEMDENAIRHFQKAQMWMEVQRYGAAIKELQIAIRLNPDTTFTASLYNNLGLAYLKVGRYPQAVEAFEKAIELNPNFSLYYENLAEAHEKSGTADVTLQQLHQQTSLTPDSPQPWYLLGQLYRASGNETASRQAFQSYIKLAPHSELTKAAQVYLDGSHGSQTDPK